MAISVQQMRKVRAEKELPESKLMQMRIKRGMTQQELAKKSGVRLRTICCYEQFQSPIESAKLQTLCNLCLALDCRLEHILESKEVIKKLKAVK